MPRSLSQLIHTRVQDGAGTPRVITLHKYKQHARDVAAYGVAASPAGRVIALESYKGVYIGRDIVGYTWFIGPFDRPSPLFFGDALAEIERFLWDEIDRQGREDAELPYLLGVEQGAIMAIAAAAAVPDLLSGVIAIDGILPIVPGWDPPLAPLGGLPVLLLNDPHQSDPGAHVLAGTRLIRTLERWGAEVTVQETPVTDVPAAAMSSWLAAHAPRHHRSCGAVT